MIHLIKLSVGTQSPASLAAWQAAGARKINGLPAHVTRMWPKRASEILEGGSIYWVIQGVIQCRQRIRALEEVTGEDGIRRCAICLDPEIIPVAAAPRRPFQGWRYLEPADAPPDLTVRDSDTDLPPELSAALAEIGVL